MNKRMIISASACMALTSTASLSAAKADKMNIVLLFVDDLGWADVGLRNERFETPHVNKLFQEGMSFERAYVGQPASSPSRASLLTGKEPVRMQIVRHIDNRVAESGEEWNMWEGDPCMMPSRNFMPLEEITYAERLKELGYYNVFVGKWHLGERQFWADRQGFDECYGLSEFGNVTSYYAPFFKFRRGGDTTKDVEKGTFMTDYLTDNAINFIENYDQEVPFTLSCSYYNVHTPNKGRTDLVEKYKKQGMSEVDANYAAQVHVVDQSVGQIREALVRKGIADNTVIIYFSDQGGYFTNAPLRGCKKIDDTLAEGGIRVPLVVHYPGVTQAGSTCETPVQAIDFFPTFVEIAGGNPKPDKQVDGVSIVPLLKGKKIKERDLHFFRAYIDQYSALIRGDWKIIKWHSGKFQMYNLRSDVGETTSVEKMYPKLFEDMKQSLHNWETETVPTYENDYRKRFKY